MKHFRILSLALAVLMLLSVLASCGEGSANEDLTDADLPASGDESATEGETLSPAEQVLNNLEDVNWNGETFGVLCSNATKSECDAVNGIVDPNGGSSQVINDAVYQRIARFEEACNLTYANIFKDPAAAQEQCRTEAQTGTGDFYLVDQRIYETVPLSVGNYLYDFVKLGVDIDQPWWDSGTADFSLGGHIFFMTGDANTQDDDVTYVMIFNKDMQKKFSDSVPNPYDTVKQGDWTLDYFSKVIQNVSSDSNGDGRFDENDTYGFLTTWEYGNTLFIGSGLRYVINSREQDAPSLYLDDKMDKAMTVLDLAQSIYHDNNATFMSPAGNEGLGFNAFTSGRGLFFGDTALYLNAFNRQMTGDYGVLPVPKYDKAQETYKTWTHESGSCLCLTSAIKDDMQELIAGTVQAYAALSSLTLKPAYYDVMLTSRNIRDAESAEMLDILFNNRVFDMSMYFGDELGFYPLFKTCVNENKDNFSSAYATQAKRFSQKVDRILSKIK